MPPPSQLAIATSSVRRLLKEEASYHKELAAEEAKIKELSDKIERGEVDEQGNDRFILKQHVCRVALTALAAQPFPEPPNCFVFLATSQALTI